MPFSRHRLEKVCGFGAANLEGVTLSKWLYVTADTLAQVAAAEYFDYMATRQMAEGDLIEVLAADGLGHFLVTGNDGAAITVARTGAVALQHVTEAAEDTVDTGLSQVAAVIATLDDDPVDGCQLVTASIGDQDGEPDAGKVVVKTWKATGDDDATLVAATTFGKKINLVAYGV